MRASGKIKFYTMPPEHTESVVSSEIVSGWAKEFDLASIAQRETAELFPKLKSASQLGQLMEVTPGAKDAGAFASRALADVEMADAEDSGDNDDNDDDGEPEDVMDLSDDEIVGGADDAPSGEDDPYQTANTKGGKLVMAIAAPTPKPTGGVKKRASATAAEYVAPVSKATKKKQQKKARKKAAANSMLDDEDDANYDAAEPYDFGTDFVAKADAAEAPADEDGEQFQFRY